MSSTRRLKIAKASDVKNAYNKANPIRLEIHGEIFESRLELELNNETEVEFITCIFKKGVYLEGVKGKKFTFTSCIGEVIEQHSNSLNKLQIKFSAFYLIDIQGGSQEVIIQHNIIRKLIINQSKCNNIVIGSELQASLDVIGTHFSMFHEDDLNEYNKLLEQYSNYDIKHLDYFGNNKYNKGSLFHISDIRIDHISLIGKINNEQSLFMSHINLNNFEIDSFENSGYTSFTNISSIAKKDSIFEIQHSNIKNVHFNNINFYHFDQVILNEVNIRESKLYGIDWKSNLLKSKSYGEDNHQNRHVRREMYRQLQLAVANSGDNTHVGELKAEELKLSMWIIPFWPISQLVDKCLLGLGWVSSNFGRSLWRPFVWLIVGNLIFFSYLINLHDYPSECWEESAKTSDYFAEYLKLFNPLRKIEGSVSSMTFIISFASRVFNSYFLYHLVISSRKFMR